jgi:hypothetical protein
MLSIMNSRTRLLAILAGVIGIVIAIRFSYWDSDSSATAVDVKFDATSWRDEVPSTEKRSLRSRMISDLLSRYSFGGWSESKVLELLGQPYKKTEFGFDLVYFIGVDRGFGIDFEWLVFDLDNKGNVIECKVIVR